LSAVEQVLNQAKARGPSQHDCYVVNLGDGGGAEVFSRDLATDCMVALRGLTPDLLRFLFDLLAAGKWVMIPASVDAVAIATSQEAFVSVPKSFPRSVICSSPDELAGLLANGVHAWEKYRDRFVGGESSDESRQINT
jgi:hypothetical protein